MLQDEKLFKSKTEAFKHRTKRFALTIIDLCSKLPGGSAASIIGNQLLRSAASVGAHYREACRARSRAEFISKLEVALQEQDEAIYWLELLIESGKLAKTEAAPILAEANEVLAQLISSIKTAKENRAQKGNFTVIEP